MSHSTLVCHMHARTRLTKGVPTVIRATGPPRLNLDRPWRRVLLTCLCKQGFTRASGGKRRHVKRRLTVAGFTGQLSHRPTLASFWPHKDAQRCRRLRISEPHSGRSMGIRPGGGHARNTLRISWFEYWRPCSQQELHYREVSKTASFTRSGVGSAPRERRVPQPTEFRVRARLGMGVGARRARRLEQ